ncbi:HAD family hydrolase [Polyangium mundeleinium]|uniref:HAD family phosphatase n=1 Tax=Polyangium mundeleinium TaxID=2995306 RepID=A0ABT5EH51_9BACT|nr:HAD family phosphatase [Polyangium mundeleinium]MDC0741154.1 HAD family phosphatase [Polyangium mundeleinium]
MSRFSPRALIFDMDGLLVDSEPLWHHVERAFARARGGEWTDEMALACTGQGIGRIVHIMGEHIGFEVDEARDVAELEDRFLAHVESLSLKPFARAFLDEARGRLPIGLASSSPRRLIDASLKRFGLTDHFDVTVSGQEVPKAKPWPDVYLRAAERLSVGAEGCLALEDSKNGVRAAKAAGMAVIAVPEGDGAAFEEIADVVVRSLEEARALVRLP